MSAAATQATNTPSFNTLADVNARLNQLGLASLSAEQASKLQQEVPRERFIRALTIADKDSGARKFLSTLVPARNTQQNDQRSPQTDSGNETADAANPGDSDNVYSMNDSDTNPAPTPESHENESNGQGDERQYISHHVYASKAALCWQVDVTKRDEPTIRLEAAGAYAERSYDWPNKVSIQLTRDELPCVAAVFLGILPEAKGSNHGVGDQKGKGFEISHQGNKVYVRVFAPGKQFPVPVSPEDTFTVASLLTRQLQEGKPWLSAGDVMTMLRATVGRMKAPQNGGS